MGTDRYRIEVFLVSLLFLISFAKATTFYNAKPPPDFTSVYNMTFTNWQFCINGTKEGLCLQPAVTANGIKYTINALTPSSVLTSFSQSILDKKTSYKFSFDVSVPAVAKASINNFTLDIVGNTTRIKADNIKHVLYTGSYEIDFNDLVSSGFSVTLNDTSVTIGNITGKAFNFDPTVKFSSAAINEISTTLLSDHSFILAYCDDTANKHDFQIFDTNGTSIVGETVFDASVYACQDKDISVTTLTTNLWAYCEYEYNADTINLQFFNSTGQNVTPFTKVATSLNSYTVSCSALNSTDIEFLLHDTTNSAINASTWHYNGVGLAPTKVYGQTKIDGGIGGSGAYVTISVTALPTSPASYFACYSSYTNSLMNCTVRWANGTVITSPWTVDSSGQGSVYPQTACFNSIACTVMYNHLYAPKKTYASNWWTNGTQIGSTQTIEPTTTPKTIGVAAFNLSTAVYGNFNNSLDRFVVFNSAFANQTANITVATPAAGYAVGIASWEMATNIRFCSATDTVNQYFIYAWTNSTTQADWAAYYSNGTAWDGTCPAAGGKNTSESVSDYATCSESASTLITRIKSISDSVTYAESMARQLALTVILSDSVATTHLQGNYVFSNEVVDVDIVLSRTISDYVTYAESIITQLGFVRAVSDSVAYAESATRSIVLTITLSDSAAYSELGSRVAILSRSLSDSLTYAESIARQLVLTRTLSDSMTYAESVIISTLKTYSKILSDSIAYAELVSRLSVLTRTVSNSATYAELMARQIALRITVFDYATYSEISQRLAILSRTMSNSVAYGESVLRQSAFVRTLSDSVAYSDSLLLGIAKVLSDYAAYSESIVRRLVLTRTLSDSVAYSESMLKGVAKVLSDSVTYAESMARQINLTRIISDSVTYAESMARQINLSRILSDSVAYAESIARRLVLTRALSDSITYVEAVIRQLSLTRTISDSVAYAESITKNINLTRMVSDSLTYAESVISTTKQYGQIFTRTVMDSVMYLESVNTIKGALRILSDSVTYGEDVYNSVFQAVNAVAFQMPYIPGISDMHITVTGEDWTMGGAVAALLGMSYLVSRRKKGTHEDDETLREEFGDNEE